MREPHWISRRALLLLHAESLAEHGGLPGMRDEGLLDSALARPRNHFAYKKKCDLADLAAAYAFGLSQDHPFRDGNKRAAFLAAGLFLGLNGFELIPEQVAAVQLFFALANGKLTEKELAEWIRQNSARSQRVGR
ncbi:MAG: type II toxin-antitoxin system death-on-curing family toxin [Candidatus Acidiferrum sp.]